jgi:hypothetical protein
MPKDSPSNLTALLLRLKQCCPALRAELEILTQLLKKKGITDAMVADACATAFKADVVTRWLRGKYTPIG